MTRKSIFDTPTSTLVDSGIKQNLETPVDHLPAETNKNSVSDSAPVDIISEERISSLGNGNGKDMSTFTTQLLSVQRNNDNDDMTSKLNSLISEAKNLSPDNFKKGGILSLFQKFTSAKGNLFAKFDTVSERIDVLIEQLKAEKQVQVDRKQDIDKLAIANAQYAMELDRDFEEGNKELDKLKAELDRRSNPQTTEESQAYQELDALYQLLEKKVADIQALRLLSVQMGPKLSDMKSNAMSLISTFDDIIGKVIPAYKLIFSQYIISLDQERGAKLQNKSMDAFNEAISKGSDLALKNTEESAKLRQRQLIDSATLKHDHENMMKGIENVKRINEEAAQLRNEYKADIREMEQKLIEVYKK